MDELVTPPFRVEQNDTHVFVEVQCPQTSPNVEPEAACEDTIFAFRCPPYYLPLHFPAALKGTVKIHRNESLVRVDLEKAEAGLEFLGLADIQPTMYAEEDEATATAAKTNGHGMDEEAQSILNDVLDRENLTTIADEKAAKSKKDQSPGRFFSNLGEETLEDNRQAAEEAENKAFDEQAYLDAWVDEYQEVEELLRWTYEPEAASSSEIAQGSSTTPTLTCQLLAAELLLAYHLALILGTGPPVSTWQLCTLSRSLSRPPAPPMTSEDTLESTLRSGYRRGLTYALHRSWKLCQRASEDLSARVRSGPSSIAKGLQEVVECLKEGEADMMEGPEEAERWTRLRKDIVEPLAAEASNWSQEATAQLANDVSKASQALTKSSVGPTWDLELLEQMAQEVLAESQQEMEHRKRAGDARIRHLCLSLTPPLGLEEDNDAFAEQCDGPTRRKFEKWKAEECPQMLADLSLELWMHSVRSKDQQDQKSVVDLKAQVVIAASRFLGQSPWTTALSRERAIRLLQTNALRPTQDLIASILQGHLRSLFMSPTQSSVTEEGRLRHERANLSGSVRSLDHDGGELWKGKRAAAVEGVEGPRLTGAASHQTLAACLAGINWLSNSFKSSAEQEPWEQLWPYLVPPLITMIEDSDPAWRERGTGLLVDGLLRSSTRSRDKWSLATSIDRSVKSAPKQSITLSPATRMLQRANLVPLLTTTLFNSLTYLSHPKGPRLLHHSLSGLFLLAKSQPEGSRLRAEALMKVIQDGIFRTWSFMPKSLSELPVSTDEEEAGENEEDQEAEQYETDVLTSTFFHLRLLAKEMGILSAPFLDVSLEFLAAQIASLYEGLHAFAGSHPKTESLQLGSSPQQEEKRQRRMLRGVEAVKAMRALVEAASSRMTGSSQSTDASASQSLPSLPPNLPQWAIRCLTSLVKAYLAVLDLKRPSDTNSPFSLEQRLQEELRLACRVWSRVCPEQMEAAKQKLLVKEPRLGKLFE